MLYEYNMSFIITATYADPSNSKTKITMNAQGTAVMAKHPSNATQLVITLQCTKGTEKHENSSNASLCKADDLTGSHFDLVIPYGDGTFEDVHACKSGTFRSFTLQHKY